MHIGFIYIIYCQDFTFSLFSWCGYCSFRITCGAAGIWCNLQACKTADTGVSCVRATINFNHSHKTPICRVINTAAPHRTILYYRILSCFWQSGRNFGTLICCQFLEYYRPVIMDISQFRMCCIDLKYIHNEVPIIITSYQTTKAGAESAYTRLPKACPLTVHHKLTLQTEVTWYRYQFFLL